MSNAVSETNTNSSNTETIEQPKEETPEPTDPNTRTIKEEVIVPEVVDSTEETKKEETFVPVIADNSNVDNSDIAKTTTKKKSTLSKVGKGLASIIASI